MCGYPDPSARRAPARCSQDLARPLSAPGRAARPAQALCCSGALGPEPACLTTAAPPPACWRPAAAALCEAAACANRNPSGWRAQSVCRRRRLPRPPPHPSAPGSRRRRSGLPAGRRRRSRRRARRHAPQPPPPLPSASACSRRAHPNPTLTVCKLVQQANTARPWPAAPTRVSKPLAATALRCALASR